MKKPDLKVKLEVTGRMVTRINLEDYSGLGGPMGSERTAPLGEWDFNDDDVAFRFLTDVLFPAIGIDPKDVSNWQNMSAGRFMKDLDADDKDGDTHFDGTVDLGAYGIHVHRVTINLIHGWESE
jgi:hypothetical protein